MVKVVDSAGTVIAEDNQQDWYPFAAIETRGKKTVEVRISSPESKGEYELYLYRAVPASGS